MTSAQPEPSAALEDTYGFLVDRFESLLDTLLAEREALTGRSPDALNDLVARKEALCAEIAGRQHTLLDALKPRTTLPDSMAELRSLADRCRTENALNGRIATRARRTTGNLLKALTGQARDDSYDRPGHTQPQPRGTGHRLGSA